MSSPDTMSDNPRKVFFDFCETLIRFQTADRFVDFCRKELRSNRMRRLQCATCLLTKLRLFSILNLLSHGWGGSVHKRLVLYQLKGIDYPILNRLGKAYFETMLQPAVIRPVIETMKRHISCGDEVWIVSGGYDIYIKHFVRHYGLKGYFASDIAFDNETGACLGRMKGKDCMGATKVSILRRYFGNDLSDTVAYSDSRSDLPLLSAVSTGFVISHSRHQKWIEQYNFQEIIWE